MNETPQHVFIIGTVWVEPTSSAAGSRMLQLIQTFLSQGWRVTFGTTAQKNQNSFDLSTLGVHETILTLNDVSFDSYVKELNPTIVLFDRFMTEEQFGWRVAEFCPSALRVLDTEDLHCLRKVRHEAIKKEEPFSEEDLLSSEIAYRELAAIFRCDLSLIISEYEQRLLERLFKVPANLLYHLPFMLPEIQSETIENWPSYEERSHFISIGNFLHAPNVDATIALKKEIWNRIRELLPKAELHVYGAYPTQQMLEFQNEKEGFYVHGYVEDAMGLIERSRVLLAPLRFGAGIKGKLSDAMLCGTPSVTTSIGAEGMHKDLPWNGFIEDDGELFVQKAVSLYQNKELWKKAQQRGIQIINSLYSKELHEKAFLESLIEVKEQLKNHRRHNFVGGMLQFHMLRSTRYLSKWIEEKHKRQSDGSS